MFKGIIPPAITPFRDDFSVDEGSYAEVVEYMIAGGVHAIIVSGTTGENYALSAEERVRQFHYAKDVINGRVPLICGVNDMTTQGACDFARAAREAGADGLLVAAPPYSLPTERELAAHCLMIDRAADLPIMLYNYPGRTGVTMGSDFLARVGQRDNFRYIKEASGDINRVHLITREFPHIELSCGAEDQALEFFVWGATSWVTPMANFFAEETVHFYDTCVRDQDFEKARRMMMALLPLTTLIEGGGKFAQSVKYAVELQGLPAGPVRPPMRALKKEFKREMREVFETAKTSLRAIMADQKQSEEVAHVRLVEQG
ncbi:MAG: dihydrodipicolinate synthase family protein [Hyphomicrobiaceae bacterium]|nr:dihydrodipicolinate synthase family protein [Hyphomicrobiaceae bacterium]